MKSAICFGLAFFLAAIVVHACGTLSRSIPNDTDDAGVPQLRDGHTTVCRLGHSC